MTSLRPWERCGVHFFEAAPATTDRRGRETRPARPASVKLSGWLGGSFRTSDPAQLRQQAALILEAADALTAQHRADAGQTPADPGQLQLPLDERASAA